MQGKHIILGLTGSIAAYKTAYLIRLLVKSGAEVRVVMTENAKHFITPITMATLSQNPVAVEFADPTDGTWHSHVKLGLWGDLLLIAPATANTLAKMAYGIADNLLTTTFLSAKCPVMAVPAMDCDMYAHPATQQNLAKLRSIGVDILEPEEGELASGLLGKGRMPEPETIMQHVQDFFNKQCDLQGKHLLITAGPTRESIDPVRYISNHSSGKMGYALAMAAAQRGAEVELVSGPVSLTINHPRIRLTQVTTAQEMYQASLQAFAQADCAILCAAVADYTVAQVANTKIKREQTGAFSLSLVPTHDIAAALGQRKTSQQTLIGFALETDQGTAHALEKLQRKNLDFIVLNSLQDQDACFGYDTNKICILDNKGKQTSYPLKSKQEVAIDILNYYLAWKK